MNEPRQYCPRGHRYDGANTYVTKTGRKQCKECRRQRMWQRRHGVTVPRPEGAPRRGPLPQAPRKRPSAVNKKLTPPREAADIAGAIQSLSATLRRRVSTGLVPEDLGLFNECIEVLKEEMAEAVAAMRAAGFSGGEIARALGVSRQYVNKRWPPRAQEEE